MDLVFGALLAFGARRAMNALATGQPLDGSDLAGVASVICETLLAAQDQQTATLQRIEAKLDRSLRQDFDRSFQTGCFRLRDAASAELSPAAQRSALEGAREAFLETTAGSTEAPQRVRGLHAAAVCSMLSGRPVMARQEFDDAWRTGFRALLEVATRSSMPVAPRGLIAVLSEELLYTSTIERERLRVALRATAEELREITHDVQHLRRLLGVPAHAAPIPETAWTIGLGSSPPLGFRAEDDRIELPDGSALVFGHRQLHAGQMGDAHLVLHLDAVPPAGQDVDISIRPLRRGMLGANPWIVAQPGGGLMPGSQLPARDPSIWAEDRKLSGPEGMIVVVRAEEPVDHVGVYLDRALLVVAALPPASS